MAIIEWFIHGLLVATFQWTKGSIYTTLLTAAADAKYAPATCCSNYPRFDTGILQLPNDLKVNNSTLLG
jgi:hypothetical protein